MIVSSGRDVGPKGKHHPWRMGIEGKKVGLVGLGRIGSVIAEKLTGLRLRGGLPHTQQKAGRFLRAYYPIWLKWPADCAALIAILPGGDATKGIISREVLQALGPEGTFINIARGTVVDEVALGGTVAIRRTRAVPASTYSWTNRMFPKPCLH